MYLLFRSVSFVGIAYNVIVELSFAVCALLHWRPSSDVVHSTHVAFRVLYAPVQHPCVWSHCVQRRALLECLGTPLKSSFVHYFFCILCLCLITYYNLFFCFLHYHKHSCTHTKTAPIRFLHRCIIFWNFNSPLSHWDVKCFQFTRNVSPFWDFVFTADWMRQQRVLSYRVRCTSIANKLSMNYWPFEMERYTKARKHFLNFEIMTALRAKVWIKNVFSFFYIALDRRACACDWQCTRSKLIKCETIRASGYTTSIDIQLVPTHSLHSITSKNIVFPITIRSDIKFQSRASYISFISMDAHQRQRERPNECAFKTFYLKKILFDWLIRYRAIQRLNLSGRKHFGIVEVIDLKLVLSFLTQRMEKKINMGNCMHER